MKSPTIRSRAPPGSTTVPLTTIWYGFILYGAPRVNHIYLAYFHIYLTCIHIYLTYFLARIASVVVVCLQEDDYEMEDYVVGVLPSWCSERECKYVIEWLKRHTPVVDGPMEKSMEANPGSTTQTILQSFQTQLTSLQQRAHQSTSQSGDN